MKLLGSVLVFCSLTVAAQDAQVKLQHYVLDSFMNGNVKLKSGKLTNHLLNYNLITQEMIFKQGEQFLAIAQPETVDTVFIGERKFVWENNSFYEWLAGSTYPLFAEYTCDVKEPGVQTGFGISTTTASVSLRSLISEGSAYGLKLPDGFEVIPKRSLLIKKDNKYHKIKNEQQVMKLFPDKKELIKEWISRNKTNFSQNKDVALLLQQLQ